MQNLMMLVVALAIASGCKKDKAPEATGSAATGSAAAGSAVATPPGSAASTPADAASADGVKLGNKAPAVGDKRSAEQSLVTTFTLTKPGEAPIPAKSEKIENKRIEVLGVNGNKMNKVKVEYTAMLERSEIGGKAKEKPSPLHGKTYVVWRDDAGAIQSTDGGGKPVSPEEAKELADEWKNDLDDEDVMERWFRDRTWKIGENVTLTPEQIAEFQKKNSNTSANSGSMKLVGVDGNIATFEVTMDVRQQVGADTLAMPMTVTAAVDIRTSWPQQLQMAGTLEGPMKGLQAKGTLVGKTTYTY